MLHPSRHLPPKRIVRWISMVEVVGGPLGYLMAESERTGLLASAMAVLVAVGWQRSS